MKAEGGKEGRVTILPVLNQGVGREEEEEGGKEKKNQKKHWGRGRKGHGDNLIQLGKTRQPCRHGPAKALESSVRCVAGLVVSVGGAGWRFWGEELKVGA